MEVLKYLCIGVLALGGAAILLFCIKSGKPFKYLLLNAIAGVAALAVINLTARFSGVHISVNEWTAAGSAIYGLPAVCGFLFLPMIFR